MPLYKMSLLRIETKVPQPMKWFIIILSLFIIQFSLILLIGWISYLFIDRLCINFETQYYWRWDILFEIFWNFEYKDFEVQSGNRQMQNVFLMCLILHIKPH